MTTPAIASCSFALIGAGGLGGPVAYALAAAGAGRLILCDPDRVELSNLQRQVQFTTADVGRRKTDALADELGRRGVSSDRITALPVRFDRDSAASVLDGADVIVECSDDPATKFAVNDAAVARGLSFAIGAVERYSGQVLAAWPGADRLLPVPVRGSADRRRGSQLRRRRRAGRGGRGGRGPPGPRGPGPGAGARPQPRQRRPRKHRPVRSGARRRAPGVGRFELPLRAPSSAL